MKIRIVKPDTIPWPYDCDGAPDNHRHAYAVENTVEIDFDGFAEALCLDAELNIVDCKTAEDFIGIFIKVKLDDAGKHSQRAKKKKSCDNGENDLVEDGFGSAWSAYCPECGKKSVSVVRPGKAQCSYCG